MAGIKIGELAQRTQCQAETIRYYEREGILSPPGRSDANYRLYDETHVERLLFVRRCRNLGMSLGEVKTLLHLREDATASCEGVDGLLDAHLEQLAARIAELLDLQEQLRALRKSCSFVSKTGECKILDGLAGDHLGK